MLWGGGAFNDMGNSECCIEVAGGNFKKYLAEVSFVSIYVLYIFTFTDEEWTNLHLYS